MRLLETLTLAAAVLLVSAGSTLANPLPGPPSVLPVRTLAELKSALEGPRDPGFANAVSQATALGPEYTWILAELAQRDDLDMMLDLVFSGLAKNGDPESLAVLREVVADTARPPFVRCFAASALAKARDRDAVPLLQELVSLPQQGGLTVELKRAIRCLESPGSCRELLRFRGDVVRFGFLLDDIESIEYSQRRPAIEYSFDPSEFRELCDLIQTGSKVIAHTYRSSGKLLFRLKDGTEASFSTDGTVLGGVGGGMLSAPELGAFIREHLKRSRSEGEPPN